MIRVLMVLPNLRVSNGVSSFVMNYYRELDKTQIHIDFAIYADVESPYYAEIKATGSKIFVLPALRYITQHYIKCKEILANEKYDIVHDNSLLITFPMMMAAKKEGVPIRILHSHNSKLGETKFKEKRNRLLLPLLFKQVTEYTACSKLAGDAMFGDKLFTVIPNVIDPKENQFDEVKRSAIRQSMQAEDKFIVITVGRAAYQKNPFYAMDVFKKVLEIEPNAEYWWIGSGPLDSELRAYVKEKNLEKHTRLLGSRTDVKNLYQAADCFFLPSVFEGLGIVNLEAQAFGLPCILSDVVPHEVAYTDLVTFVSLKEDIEIWADKILSVVHLNPNRLVYNQKLKESNFSSKQAGESLTLLYKELFAKK